MPDQPIPRKRLFVMACLVSLVVVIAFVSIAPIKVCRVCSGTGRAVMFVCSTEGCTSRRTECGNCGETGRVSLLNRHGDRYWSRLQYEFRRLGEVTGLSQ